MGMKHKTLSSQSAELVKYFADRNQPGFTIQEAFDLLKASIKLLAPSYEKKGKFIARKPVYRNS